MSIFPAGTLLVRDAVQHTQAGRIQEFCRGAHARREPVLKILEEHIPGNTKIFNILQVEIDLHHILK